MNPDKRIVLAMVFSLVLFNILALYALREPQRQAAAAQRQLGESITRGAELYGGLCSGCHGQGGQGQIGPAIVGQEYLKRHQFKNGDADDSRKAQTLMTRTIARGRANSVMPAWSDEEGGSLNREQIHELADFLLHGTAADWESAASHAPAVTAPAPASAPAAAAGPEAGQELFTARGCAACHGSKAEGGMGPSLAGMTGAQVTTQVRTPKDKMPAFPPERLSEDELRQIITFVESLPR